MGYKLKTEDVVERMLDVGKIRQVICMYTKLTIYEIDDMHEDEFVDLYENIVGEMTNIYNKINKGE
ncbi:hypothetical protein [Virgibacillus sp. CBA3643]|uniref:hypothetical protein n=1 Tax=Virgibacillus sp. CBA3643 TaxID=2942278 RepID=UPI0035A29AD8